MLKVRGPIVGISNSTSLTVGSVWELSFWVAQAIGVQSEDLLSCNDHTGTPNQLCSLMNLKWLNYFDLIFF